MSETTLKDGQRKRGGAAQFKIEIAGADLDFHATNISDPKPTGRQIAQASGAGNPDELIVLQQLENLGLEELRPDETTNLRGAGAERFVVVKSDRTYRFVVEGLKIEWPLAKPTALIVKKLLHRGDDVALVQELRDEADRVIEDCDELHLDAEGTERFYFRERERTVTVKYNHEPFELERRTYTTEELIAEFGVTAGYVLEWIAPDGEFILLNPGDTLKIVKCLEFVSHAPTGGAA